jgi:hypothetical protein
MKLLLGVIQVAATVYVAWAALSAPYLMDTITTQPTAPQPSLGLIVPYENHGAVHYMTEAQSLLLEMTFVGGAAAAIIGVLAFLIRTQGRPWN